MRYYKSIIVDVWWGHGYIWNADVIKNPIVSMKIGWNEIQSYLD